MKRKCYPPIQMPYILLTILFFFSCSNQESSIKMKGSDTEVNLAVNLAEKFATMNPQFNIAISGGGSGLGITSLLNGQADIANSSRPLSKKEIQQFNERDIAILTIVFAEDATAFVVHQDLPLDEIDVTTLGAILQGTIQNWSEITSLDLPINIYGRQSSSGTHSFIKNKLGIEFSPAAKEMTGNAQIIEGVKADKSGLGYVGAGYIADESGKSQGIKVLKIKESPSSIAYSPIDSTSITQNLYFFQRPLYQFVLKDSWHKVKPFVDFEKSPIGTALIKENGYYITDHN